MKKIFYFLTAISLVFASCEPMENIYNEIDTQQGNDKAVGDITYTLTEDDYTEVLELDETYFMNVDEAKTMLPSFLTSKYPTLGVTYNQDGSVNLASSANITFNYSDPVVKSTYTLSDADYAEIELNSLNTNSDFNKFFGYKFPNTAKGSIVDLTYLSEPIITNYTLTNDDYDLVGNGRFNNFDIRTGKNEETIEARRIKIQKILLNNFESSAVGTKYKVTYATYDGTSRGTATMDVVLKENTPSAATDYELTMADYALVGNGQYNNFDIRNGKNEETIEARRAKIETILLNNFPSASVGDLYNVTYKIFNGSAGTMTMLVEFNGTGYDIFSPLTYELYTFALETVTSRFTYTTKWDAPFILTSDDYTAMGQRYPNFSGRNDDQKAEAQRIIAIYLGQKNPFAGKDDFIAVQYASYAGGGVTETLNVNFVYDGEKWRAIPEVISTTLQFGHDGKTWVPDNTIKYTLTAADYALVGNDRYGNFDVRTGKDEASVEARLAKINTILLNNFPADEDGQKYIVFYNIYNGAAGVWSLKVIKEGGQYILN